MFLMFWAAMLKQHLWCVKRGEKTEPRQSFFAAAAENLGLKVFLGFHFNLSRNFFLMQIEIQERQKHQEGKETKTFWTKSDIFKKLKSHFFRCACACVCVG